MAKPKREAPAVWDKTECDTLADLVLKRLSPGEVAAKMTGRTEAQCRAQASELKLEFHYDSALRSHLKGKGLLVREECGGCVGTRWTTAERSGKSFDSDVCETFAHYGWLVDGERPGQWKASSRWLNL